MTVVDDDGNVMLKVPMAAEADRFLQEFAWASGVDIVDMATMAINLGVKRMIADLDEWNLPQPGTLCG